MVFNTIKLELDCKKQYEKAIDSLTSKQVAFWLNNNLKFKLSFFDNGASFELSSAKKIYLGIKAMNGFGEISDSFDILKEIDVSTTSSNSIDIEISSSDISMKMTAGLKWLVVYAEDSNGGFLTFFGGKIICQNDASDGVASGESINRIEKYVKENIGKISEALEDAKAKINTWSEQTERFAQNEANISALFASKANKGALHFYGGNIQCSGLANKPIPNVNSIAFRWKCDNNTYSKIEKNQRVFGYSASAGLSWYHLAKVSGGALQWYVKYEDNSQQYVSVTTATWESLIDGKWHNVEFISTGTAFEIWVDGVLKQSVARNNTANFATPASNFVVSYASS
ncbi:MAG: hypothetical protein J6K91_09185, partial [Opitutales bacterium]|nr:hypothetical protein [Opitutales bacterium]